MALIVDVAIRGENEMPLVRQSSSASVSACIMNMLWDLKVSSAQFE